MSFPTVGVLDSFNGYSAGALPSPWAIAFGDSEPAISDGSGHAAGWNFTGYSASYHTALGSLSDTELYCTIVTPPSHLSGDGIFLTYRSQKVSGGGAPTGSQNGYTLNILGDGFSGWVWNLGKIGFANLIANTAITLSAGDKIGISVIGSTHTVWYCPISTGVWAVLGTATDSAYTSGWVGIEFHNTSAQTQTAIDDLGAGAPVVSPGSMTITNQTNQDYWFGPLHLKPGVGQTLSVDVTTDVSLYLTNDEVADDINYAYLTGKITVTSPPTPFPRATGEPAIMHGDGNPEGYVYAPQGSIYLRRDNARVNVYQKTTLEHIATGWTQLGRAAQDELKRLAFGYRGETYSRDSIRDTIAPTSGDIRATAVAFAAGDVVTSVIVNVSAAPSGITTFKVGLWDANGNLLASSTNNTASQSTGTLVVALSAAYTIPADGLYYLGYILVATTVGSYGGVTGTTGKMGSIGSGPKGALIKTGQSDIGSLTTGSQSDTATWLGWS